MNGRELACRIACLPHSEFSIVVFALRGTLRLFAAVGYSRKGKRATCAGRVGKLDTVHPESSLRLVHASKSRTIFNLTVGIHGPNGRKVDWGRKIHAAPQT